MLVERLTGEVMTAREMGHRKRLLKFVSLAEKADMNLWRQDEMAEREKREKKERDGEVRAEVVERD
ncbi:hypothetical protein CDL15_Pgr014706 [Punica granatum]|nr:hypothetical protein CDL15_Pgr014706 [Punica granatum]